MIILIGVFYWIKYFADNFLLLSRSSVNQITPLMTEIFYWSRSKRSFLEDEFNFIVDDKGRTVEGSLYISNYRLYLFKTPVSDSGSPASAASAGAQFTKDINVPLGLIDYIECKDIFYLNLYCKDARSFRYRFFRLSHTLLNAFRLIFFHQWMIETIKTVNVHGCVAHRTYCERALVT